MRSLAEALLQEVAAMTGRIPLQRAEHGVAELLVEVARLEAEGVEPDIAAAARHGLGLGAAQKIAAEPGTAQRLGQPQQIDEQPLPAGPTPQSAQQLAIRVLDQHGEETVSTRTGLALVIGPDAGENGVVGGLAGCIGDQDLGRHAALRYRRARPED